MKSVTLDFEAVAERSLDRVGGTGANQVGWSNLISSSQYRPLFEQLKRSRWSDESQPQKLLDWGAGRGIQMGVAADLGYSVTGVEFYEPELLVGLQREFDGRIDFQKIEDPRRLPFADQTFDVVLSMGVLEHVRETGGSEAASLAEIARVLRPGGTFICLHFPQKSSWVEFLARNLKLPIHHHQFRYKSSDIREIVSSAPTLRLERQWRYGFLPRNQVARLFGKRSNNQKIAEAFDKVDRGLACVFPALCTNHGFVATSQPASTASR